MTYSHTNPGTARTTSATRPLSTFADGEVCYLVDEYHHLSEPTIEGPFVVRRIGDASSKFLLTDPAGPDDCGRTYSGKREVYAEWADASAHVAFALERIANHWKRMSDAQHLATEKARSGR